jgi:YggT family protein
MAHALWFLIETAGSLLAAAFLLRAAAWWVQLSPRNPLVQFVSALTDWLVKPLRRALPASGRTDWSSLAGALLVASVLAAIRTLAMGSFARAPAFGAVVLLAVFWLIKWSLYLLNTLVIVQAVLSWVNPNAPIAPVVERLTDPFLGPIRRVIPTIGGVDVSPVVLIVATQLALMMLESILVSLLAPIA